MTNPLRCSLRSIAGVFRVPLLGLQLGCVAVLPYQPQENLVSKDGFETVKARLSELLTRSVQPQVTSVEVTEEFVRYGWTQTVMGPFYAPMTTGGLVQIFYANVARIEVYENHNVFLWGPGDQRVDKILFANDQDAKALADSITSWRAARRPGYRCFSSPSRRRAREVASRLR
jgi:hypothetical protein